MFEWDVQAFYAGIKNSPSLLEKMVQVKKTFQLNKAHPNATFEEFSVPKSSCLNLLLVHALQTIQAN